MKRKISVYLSGHAHANFRRVAGLRGESLSAAAEHLFTRIDPSRLKLRPRDARPAVLARSPIERALSDRAVFAVRDRFAAGHSMRRLAREFGVSLATIQRAVHGQNNYRYAQRRGPAPLPVPVVEQVRSLKAECSYREIQRNLAIDGVRVSVGTLKNIVDRRGAYEFR
ncbi:MAG: helix-turn-helix domain-containing protein [Aeromonas sp.]